MQQPLNTCIKCPGGGQPTLGTIPEPRPEHLGLPRQLQNHPEPARNQHRCCAGTSRNHPASRAGSCTEHWAETPKLALLENILFEVDVIGCASPKVSLTTSKRNNSLSSDPVAEGLTKAKEKKIATITVQVVPRVFFPQLVMRRCEPIRV